MVDAWQIYLICIGLTIILSFAFIKALEACALGMIKFMIGLYSFAMICLGGFLFYNYMTMVNKTEIRQEQAQGFLTGALVVWGITALFLCMIFCSWKRIQLAATIIQATADYLTDVKRVTLVPILEFLLLVGFLVWWIYSGAYLFSTGEVKHDPSKPFGQIQRSSFVENLFTFHLVYLLWSVFFIDHLGNFVMSTVACIWYFAADRNRLNSPVFTAFSWGIFYHIGTVAFGSLVLALVWLIRTTIEYMK